jgi:hypothetical protein
MMRFRSTLTTFLFGSLLALAPNLAAAQDAPAVPAVPERPYPIEIRPGFTSAVSFEDVERVALGTLTRPLSVEDEGGSIRVVGLPPAITRVVGCPTADLHKVDERITPPDELSAVWLVELHGSFIVRHVGKVEDVDGYLLIHTASGAVLQSGVFVPEEKVAP